MRRIHAWLSEGGPCFEYRVRLPFSQLSEDWQVSWSFGPPEEPVDVVVGCRLTGDVPAWLDLCADPDTLTVYDADDDLIYIDPANTVPHSIYAPVAEQTKALVRAADAVTVCTEYVADVYSLINPRVFLLPVCMDPALLSPPAGRSFAFQRIGWAGSVFHFQDWEHLAPLLPEVARLAPLVRFVSVGSDYTRGAFGPLLQVEPNRPWNLHLAALDCLFDIGLAPLRRSTWNRGKSWTKPLEYAAVGIPVVAEAWGQYPAWVQDGVNGLLVRNEDEWVGAIMALLDDDDMRASMAEAAFTRAQAQTIDKHAHLWAHVYEGVW